MKVTDKNEGAFVVEVVVRWRCEHCGKIVERRNEDTFNTYARPDLECPMWRIKFEPPNVHGQISIATLACRECMLAIASPRFAEMVRKGDAEASKLRGSSS